MFGTIVVGVDESGHADNAVREVARIAAGTGDAVLVFHGVVLHPSRAQPYTTETPDEAQLLVDRYVKELTDQGIAATGLVHRKVETGVGGAMVNIGRGRRPGCSRSAPAGGPTHLDAARQRGPRGRAPVTAAGARRPGEDEVSQAGPGAAPRPGEPRLVRARPRSGRRPCRPRSAPC